MRRLGFRLLVGMTLLGMPVCAQDIPVVDTDSLATDSLVIDSLNMDPEWYVAPVIPASLRAPMRTSAAAATCNRVEAIQTFDIDSVLIEGTYYEYDDRGNVISSTVWAYASDGTMTGKSKNEYAFDAAGTQTMTAVYVWEDAANDWKGTEKYEYIYQTVAGEKKMISNTSLAWLNGAWVADHRYTYGYDEAGREISYFEYNRNTTTNELQPVLGREQGWTNDLQTLEANYTAYANGQWTAGTKKEWAFDENGTQTMFTTFTMSNGAWVGSSKETWTYGGPTGQLTLHEKYGWANNDWSLTLQEETEYAGANIIRIENYSYTNGITTGTKKEEYAFVDGKKVQTIVYAWKNSSWVGSLNETWVYTATGKLTLHEKSAWVNDDWSKTLREENEYSGANLIRVENYSYTNGVATGTKKEEYTYTGGKKTEFVTYAWLNGAWANATKETWSFTNGKQTLHEQFVGEGINWSKTLSEENEYSGTNLIRVENYSYANGVTTGTKKETYAYSGSDKEIIVYAWANTAWIESTKEVWGYTSGKQTLHETYEWYNDGWSVTLRELSGYDAAGNKNSIENYTGSEGVLIGTQKEEYTFNNAKEVIVTVKYKWSEGVWVGDTKNEVGYREGNTEYSEANYTWNGSAWVGTGNKTVTEYYAEDKVSAAWAYAWSSVAGDWVYAARRICEYDGKGRSIGDTIYTYSNGAWEYFKLQTHGFDSQDNDTLAVTATWNGAEWMATFIAKGTYTYTPSGDPLLVETYTGVEGSWVGQKKRVWKYNDFGSQTLYHVYEWKNTGWVNKEKREQTYDANNHLLVDQSYSWNSKKWEGVDKDEYAYDENGHQCMSAHYLWLNGGWYGISKSEQIMDENGIVLTSFSSSWKTNKWVYTFQYNYIYDEGGRIAEKITQQYKNNNWINYKRETHGYYVSGNKVEEIATYAYQWKSSTWRLVSLLHKHYDDLEHKLRSEEIGSWDSSTGNIQSYSDNHYFYNCDPHFYTVRFVNYDGKVLANMTTQEGETPTYVGSNPTREGNAEYSYTFSGWNPTLGPVTANITYTATFTATKNTYTITWKNEDGTQIDHATYDYGVIPTHADATRANTAEWKYTFKGWTPGMGMVSGDAVYTAEFDSIKNKYTIIFQNYDETELQRSEVEYGVTPEYEGATPTKPADAQETYNFAGWDPQVVPVTGTATYTAQYTGTVNSYTIKFMNGETELQSSQVAYGEMPVYEGATPTKDATAQYTYDFSGWDSEIVAVTGAKTYNAQFTGTVNKYTVTFMNGETELQSSEVEYGTEPVYQGATPAKDATAQYTYTFTGWDKEIASVTGDETYTAQFSSTVNKYVITFMNGTTELQSSEVEFGTVPTYEGATPTKPGDAQYTYDFLDWDEEIAAVTGDATYKATFSQTKNSYTITWVDENDTEISHETLEYGATPSHTDASKDNTAEWTYSFTGWSPAIVDVVGDATYKATFSQTKNTYTITFLNYDGTELQTGDVEYGVVPTYTSATPTKPADAQGTYTFAGWDEEIAAVTGAKTYTATFTGVKGTYTITFYFGDGVTILSQMELAYGEMPEMTLEPARLADPEFSYTFAGWEPAIAPVTADADYVAVYTATTNSYTIIFRNDDGTELQRDVLEYGILPIYAGEEPTKEEDERYTYEFAGWKPAVDIAKADAVYTATYTATKKKKQGIEDVVESGAQATKIYIEGNIYILRAGHAYAPDGTKLY